MHTDNIRRRKNGTIDIDFYRRAAFPADRRHLCFAVAGRSTAAEREPRLRVREYPANSG